MEHYAWDGKRRELVKIESTYTSQGFVFGIVDHPGHPMDGQTMGKPNSKQAHKWQGAKFGEHTNYYLTEREVGR